MNCVLLPSPAHFIPIARIKQVSVGGWYLQENFFNSFPVILEVSFTASGEKTEGMEGLEREPLRETGNAGIAMATGQRGKEVRGNGSVLFRDRLDQREQNTYA